MNYWIFMHHLSLRQGSTFYEPLREWQQDDDDEEEELHVVQVWRMNY
jgi:hypothetical protein